ncbi:putative diphthine synthase [Platanthera zijinensis]|uniref:diphthine methyl ester synthase n=1 Tax=Platanthera zijinensis TaxID=2320716 RepID=A0AAP0BD74_9ASPA
MLYIVGLGLGDERDITLRGLEAVRSCKKVYIEAYTSLLSFGISLDGLSRLEKLYGKTIIVADREMVEEKVDQILIEASESDIAFLVVGDPFGATTHSDLVVRAKKLSLEVEVIHNASIMNAIGVCGLQLYRYGETVSIPFFTETWRPDSFYEKILRNKELGLHTLCLLGAVAASSGGGEKMRGERNGFRTVGGAMVSSNSREGGETTTGSRNGSIGVTGARACRGGGAVAGGSGKAGADDIRVKEPSIESLCRGKKCFEPPKFMTINTAIEQLLEVKEAHRISAYDENSRCVGLARVGSVDQMIVAGSMKDLLNVDFGAPLHCFVIVGDTHPVEEEMLEFYTLK